MSLFVTMISATDAEAPAFRQAPEGNYLVTIRSVRKVKANSGTEGIEIQFTMNENLDEGADLEGVTLSKCRLRDTMWVTENTVERVRRDFVRMEPNTAGKSLTDAMEELPGAEAVVRVGHITEDRAGKPISTPWLEGRAYYSKDWYMAKRVAKAA